jgi:hypothetical protein
MQFAVKPRDLPLTNKTTVLKTFKSLPFPLPANRNQKIHVNNLQTSFESYRRSISIFDSGKLCGMLGLFGKKKIKEREIAKIFVGTINEVAISGFNEILDFVKTDSHFNFSPDLTSKSSLEGFLFTVFSANLKYLEDYFEKDQLDRIRIEIINEFAESLEEKTTEDVLDQVDDYMEFILSIKNPSGDLTKLLAKAIFQKLNLTQYQNDNFQKINEPNPIVLKELEEITTFFVWNWDDLFNKYKLVN